MITFEKILEFITGMIVYGFVDGLAFIMFCVFYSLWKEYRKTKEDKHDEENDR